MPPPASVLTMLLSLLGFGLIFFGMLVPYDHSYGILLFKSSGFFLLLSVMHSHNTRCRQSMSQERGAWVTWRVYFRRYPLKLVFAVLISSVPLYMLLFGGVDE